MPTSRRMATCAAVMLVQGVSSFSFPPSRLVAAKRPSLLLSLLASSSDRAPVARSPSILARSRAWKQATSGNYLFEQTSSTRNARIVLQSRAQHLRLSTTYMHGQDDETEESEAVDERDDWPDNSATPIEELYADMASKVKICYKDDHLVVVSKPANLLVHKSYISRQDKVFLLQIVRDRVSKQLHLVNRLDRATSGLVLFAADSEMAALVQESERQDL
eukprot:764091-Hanusia_phi.AAC.29